MVRRSAARGTVHCVTHPDDGENHMSESGLCGGGSTSGASAISSAKVSTKQTARRPSLVHAACSSRACGGTEVRTAPAASGLSRLTSRISWRGNVEA